MPELAAHINEDANGTRPSAGLKRAAVLLFALGDRHGEKLRQMLDAHESAEIAQLLLELENASTRLAGRLLGDLATEAAFARASQDHAVIAPEQPGSATWDYLADVHETVLASYLKGEFPQTAAVILSRIPTDHAARVLTELPDHFALEVVQRMLGMETVRPDILEQLAQTLRAEFMASLTRGAKSDPHERMADIFNKLERNTETRFLAALERGAPQSAARIKAMLLRFDDIAALDPGAIQTLLRHVDRDALATALKGATDAIRDIVFSNMSERAASALREEMETLGAPRLRDVDDAQTIIIAAAKTLAIKGEIAIGGKTNNDALL